MQTISKNCHAKGFTLVELIAVLVILGIVAAIGSQFVAAAVDSYAQTEKRSKLVSRGQATIEQMTRQLRNALPYSVRVSSSGNCLEFMPIVGGATYEGSLPDESNSAPATNSITTAPLEFGLGSASNVVVGALSSSEIYSVGSPNSRVAAGAFGSPPYTVVPLASNHRFLRNSVNRRVFITDDPKRFCVTGSTLLEYRGYGLSTTGISDSNPSGAQQVVLAENVEPSGPAFRLSAGSVDRNTVVKLSLTYIERGEQVTLNAQVMVRNVP